MRRMTRVTRRAFPATKRVVLQKLLSVALLAGLLAGLAVAAVQHVTTTPLVFAAEVYETAQHAHDAIAADEGWKPAEGWQRAGATAVATIAVATG